MYSLLVVLSSMLLSPPIAAQDPNLALTPGLCASFCMQNILDNPTAFDCSPGAWNCLCTSSKFTSAVISCANTNCVNGTVAQAEGLLDASCSSASATSSFSNPIVPTYWPTAPATITPASPTSTITTSATGATDKTTSESAPAAGPLSVGPQTTDTTSGDSTTGGSSITGVSPITVMPTPASASSPDFSSSPDSVNTNSVPTIPASSSNAKPSVSQSTSHQPLSPLIESVLMILGLDMLILMVGSIR